MSCPRIEVDLCKIRHNTQTLVKRLGLRGVSVTGVTKAVCGHPAIAQAMLDGGATALADSRISNVQRLRSTGLTGPITLIRTPMLSQVDEVVQSCEASYNTEILVISALAAAAIRNGSIHGIILMVEMGDRRDGIFPEKLAEIAQQVRQMPGVRLEGIGANFACLSGVAPTASEMVAFGELAEEIERKSGPSLKIVSGGGSANLPWAFGGHATGRVNDLRLGEAILLGVEPLSGDRIGGLHRDAFTLLAEVIEKGVKPKPFPIALAAPSAERRRNEPAYAASALMILALGHQDTDIQGLSLPTGNILIGATSDHLVLGTSQSPPPVGSEVKILMNYNALMLAMAAPDIKVSLLDNLPSGPSECSKHELGHLAPA
ncbi:Ornithine racemase [Sulfitobacter sp. DSM 110093]|uniref:alanine/ornithine racemase family PLP-dependent enzyme n=1 Tax=Sulfitobacter sp. DSM 110093 TaxID=2883127 RepID=UPI001FAE42EC|nr:alanine/ornithine racemase family PLP-dependent enzyme [Sulfitobacter sp. DSM 110093]UOA32957.1 Ornithine racemase [Sulfitobacter sp. DSM 110093]